MGYFDFMGEWWFWVSIIALAVLIGLLMYVRSNREED